MTVKVSSSPNPTDRPQAYWWGTIIGTTGNAFVVRCHNLQHTPHTVPKDRCETRDAAGR